MSVGSPTASGRLKRLSHREKGPLTCVGVTHAGESVIVEMWADRLSGPHARFLHYYVFPFNLPGLTRDWEYRASMC